MEKAKMVKKTIDKLLRYRKALIKFLKYPTDSLGEPRTKGRVLLSQKGAVFETSNIQPQG
jgi:hypothetical protein